MTSKWVNMMTIDPVKSCEQHPHSDLQLFDGIKALESGPYSL